VSRKAGRAQGARDPFQGTAEYYANFRPGLPDELVQRLVATMDDSASERSLLDLGTGTGQVALALLPYVRDVVAVDQDAEMIRLAKRDLGQAAPVGTRVRVLRGRAEDVRLPQGWWASLVTMGRAFHWMDQGAVLGHIEPFVRPAGTVAVFAEPSLWGGRADWQQAVKRTIQDFLGEARRAGMGLYHEPDRPFRAALEASAFSVVEELRIPFKRTWKPETILGLLYSTSFSARQLYGDRVREFEVALRKTLDGWRQQVFIEDSAFDLILARRPNGGA
jgi:SAM-dependent methyltransferase